MRSDHRVFAPAFRRAAFLAGAAALAAWGMTAAARADENIGGAISVVNLVTGDLASGDKVKLLQGDQVFRDEGVRTDPDSSARLVLRDNTNLLLGPSSLVKLDRFVYAGPTQPGAIAVNLVKGALRFATGDADKKAYVIATPTAALGVRGTVLKILAVGPSRTFVVLGEGGAVVCTRGSAKRRCLQLTQPDQAVEVTATEVKWNPAAAAAVSAVIDAIPESSAGPVSPGGGGAGPPTTTKTAIAPPSSSPLPSPPPSSPPPGPTAKCGDGEGDGDHDGRHDHGRRGFDSFGSGLGGLGLGSGDHHHDHHGSRG